MSIREGQPSDTLSAAVEKIKRGFGHRRRPSAVEDRMEFRSLYRRPAVCYHCAGFCEQDRIVMTLQLNSRDDFTIENYAETAWDGAAVAFTAAALRRMAVCRASFMRLIDSDPAVTIYGVTSGYGQFARVRLKPDERRAHAKKPPF